MASAIFFLAVSLFLEGTLGELVCEQLPVKVCAFAVASSGKRCSLETYASRDGTIGFQCKTSAIFASAELGEHIENGPCISSCGVSREAVGISTDKLMEPQFSEKLCSTDCQTNCLNIVDLYTNLALAEGVYLPALCKALLAVSLQEKSEVQSSAADSSGQNMEAEISGAASSIIASAASATVASANDSAEPPTSNHLHSLNNNNNNIEDKTTFED